MSRVSSVHNTANPAHRLRNASYDPTSTSDAQKERRSAGVPENTANHRSSHPSKTLHSHGCQPWPSNTPTATHQSLGVG
jgi:hypothetical protein